MTRSFIYNPLCLLLTIVAPAYTQFVGSGSKGTDGALELTTPGEVLFDPSAFEPVLNRSADNVYHFTNIYIAKGVIVKLSGKILRAPVFWLAQGPVRIDGNIDLGGDDGSPSSGRFPNNAGAGGYAGGIRGTGGYGPGAGNVDGVFTGNQFLVPLVGGSGGAGGQDCGGGAGGGALLIASSNSITLNGTISANGGNADPTCAAGGGSGGAVRLVAPVIDGSGPLSAKGGQPRGGAGRVRIEAFDNRFTGDLNGTPFAQGKPFGLFLPPGPPPSVRVVSIGGVAVATPHFMLNHPFPIVIVVEARFVPPGTVIDVELFPEEGQSQTISTTPLVGTLELSRASVSVKLPTGASRCYVKAAWKYPAIQQEK